MATSTQTNGTVAANGLFAAISAGVDMRAVLYADDMEPITVVSLSAWTHRYLSEHGMVKLAVMRPVATSFVTFAPPKHHDPIVTVIAERFVRHGREHMMLFTRDEEAAMLLKCAFLPGQHAGIQERERAAFARGFLDALSRVGWSRGR